MEPIVIRDRGRGPELARIRVTVYDIIPYLERGDTPEYIAEVMPVSKEEVLALMDYIEQHKEEVMAVHRKIEERNARGNSPEVEAILATSPHRARLRAAREEYYRKQGWSLDEEEDESASDNGRRQH